MHSLIFILFAAALASGFSWGERAQEKQTASTPTPSARAEQQTTANVRSPATYDEYTPSTGTTRARQAAGDYEAPAPVRQKAVDPYADTRERGSDAAQTAKKLSAPAAAGATGFPSELISSLAEGDEETRRARIESLKRLSMALTKMRAEQQAPPAVAAEEEDPQPRRSGRRN